MSSELKRFAQFSVLVAAIFAVESSQASAAEPTAADGQNATALSSSSAPAAASATATPKDATAKSESKSRTWQVIFVIEKNSAKCDEALKRLNAPGGDFEKRQKKVGWHIGADKDCDVRIVDREEIPELVAQLNVREYPAVGCVEKGELVRSFKSGCTTPLDCWTLCWLASGVNWQPAKPCPKRPRWKPPDTTRCGATIGQLTGTLAALIDHLSSIYEARTTPGKCRCKWALIRTSTNGRMKSCGRCTTICTRSTARPRRPTPRPPTPAVFNRHGQSTKGAEPSAAGPWRGWTTVDGG